LRHDLHPGADAGSASANPHQAKIAVAKSFEDPADQANASPWHADRFGGPRLSTLRDEAGLAPSRSHRCTLGANGIVFKYLEWWICGAKQLAGNPQIEACN
jgi:hypothetical protein